MSCNSIYFVISSSRFQSLSSLNSAISSHVTLDDFFLKALAGQGNDNGILIGISYL